MSELKLHIGCGAKYIEGFEHIDASPQDHLTHCVDVTSLPMYEDNSVDLIYACHILEHFGRHEFAEVLDEWFRVIKPGGILRLAVPNFESVVDYYNENRDTNCISKVTGLVSGGQKDMYDYHKMIFDQTSLTEHLLNVGFSRCELWDWRETEHSHVDDYSQCYLPHMEKDTGKLMSLNLQAIK